jgi:MFS family permease
MPAYRSVVVIVGAVILTVAVCAIVNGMSAFAIPMQESFAWRRSDTTLINFASIVAGAFGGLVLGPQADRRGMRPVVLLGVTVLMLCYLCRRIVMISISVYLFVFIRNILMHLVEKILFIKPLNFGGITPCKQKCPNCVDHLI